jgi:hypothetical protein
MYNTTLLGAGIAKSLYRLSYGMSALLLWSIDQSFWLQIQRSGSIPGAIRCSGSGTGSTQPRGLNWGATWKEKERLQYRESRIQPYGSTALTTWHPVSAKVVTNFAHMRRSLGRYSSLTDSGHGILVLVLWDGWSKNWSSIPYKASFLSLLFSAQRSKK